VALVAFCATSKPENRHPMRGTYLYPGSLEQFERLAERAGIRVQPPHGGHDKVEGYKDGADDTWLFLVNVPRGDTRVCDYQMGYDFALTRFRDGLLVELRAMRGQCGFDADQVREAVRFFNRGVARPLGLQPARPLLGYPRAQPTEQPLP
jgi:hypothetical protein